MYLQVRIKFTAGALKERAKTCYAYELSRDFQNVLGRLMVRCSFTLIFRIHCRMICLGRSLAKAPDSKLQDVINIFIAVFTCPSLCIPFLSRKSG